MAISLGATISNADDTTTATLSANHTTDANTKALVVVVKGYDSSDADSAIKSLTFNAEPLIEAEYYRNTGDGDDAFVAVYYQLNPAITLYGVVLTMEGSCTDLSWDAVNLVTDASADTIILDSTNAGSTGATTTHTVTVDPAETDSICIGGIVNKDSSVNDLAVTTGNELAGSEVDFGQQTSGSAWVLEQTAPTGEATIVWEKTTSDDSWACSATFYEQFYPTVALNTPGDTAEISDTTPDLLFTGTDDDDDEIEYQLQVDTVDTFDSGGYSYGSNTTIDSYSESNQNDYKNGGKDYLDYVGQAIPAISGLYRLNDVKFYLNSFYDTSATGNIYAKIYAVTGTPGTDGKATGSVLATSDAIDANTLTDSYTLITFTFSGAQQINIGDNIAYAIMLDFSGVTGDSTLGPILVGTDSSSPEHSGNLFDGIQISNLYPDAGEDACFYINGEPMTSVPLLDKLSETPDDTFSGTGDPHPWASDNQITYTVQGADELTAPDTYYWRVRGKDPGGSDTFGDWSDTYSFDLTTGVTRRVFITT